MSIRSYSYEPTVKDIDIADTHIGKNEHNIITIPEETELQSP